ncbi:MAG: hypothetical protein ABR981_02840 [Candidatus Micrarchaeaceae archaeon]
MPEIKKIKTEFKNADNTAYKLEELLPADLEGYVVTGEKPIALITLNIRGDKAWGNLSTSNLLEMRRFADRMLRKTKKEDSKSKK